MYAQRQHIRGIRRIAASTHFGRAALMAGQKKKASAAEAEPEAGSDAGGEPRVSLWERLENPSPAPRTVLTPARIAEVAVGIADAEGIDAVTMRRLATELGVAPMAAYRYVSGKDDLLELMVDRVYGELPAPETGAGWRATLRTLATSTRDVVLRHPWLVQLPSARAAISLTPNRLAVVEWGMAALAELDLPPDELMVAVDTVGAFVQGRTASEVATRRLMEVRGAADGHALRTQLAPEMTYLMNTGRYPTFHAYLGAARHKDDPRWQFETALDCILDGLATRLGI
ncbi:TetR/AcrR family transcriptional regulator [Embleya sp. NBC_00888]|uniref:TetR/AcrR family transcriptional regulator n=1 Tax=Embleya sp. NBC_00888 TaxID=2975960 RepID=UPI00386415D2